MHWFDSLIDFILRHIIYPSLIFLAEVRHYVIPADTTADYVVRKNVVYNIILIIADLITIILIVLGSAQQVVTYVSISTFLLYAGIDQFSIYRDQLEKMKDDKVVCIIRGKKNKYLTKATPNLINLLIIVISFELMVMLAVLDGFQLIRFTSVNVYYWIIL